MKRIRVQTVTFYNCSLLSSVLLPLSDSYLAFTACRLAVALLLPANLALVPAEILKSGPGGAHPDNAASMWVDRMSPLIHPIS